MDRAYKKTYLNGAMRNLAVMMDCGVRKYGYPIEEFYQKFLSSNVSRQFAKGNPRYLVGMSGAELADSVVEASGGTVLEENDGTYSIGPEYWAGWALAYYHWFSRRSFAYMLSAIEAPTIVVMNLAVTMNRMLHDVIRTMIDIYYFCHCAIRFAAPDGVRG